MKYSYDFPKADVTVDIILCIKDKIMLIQRKNDPFKDAWALPGGFIEMDEDLVDSAKRELFEETNIKDIDIKQFKTYGKPGRDPRGRTITVCYYALLNEIPENYKANDDAKAVDFFDINNLPILAFDHNVIIKDFIEKILS